MIDTIIFDFGNVFINLAEEAPFEHMRKLGLVCWNEDLDNLNKRYEKGKIKEADFFNGLHKYIPNKDLKEIRDAWNAILLDFPLYRLEFLQRLSSQYRLFLLSNTDATHIEKFESKVGETFSREFYQCFEKVYFSFEIGLRKPDPEIFNYIIKKHELSPKRTLFVDDNKHNTEVAANLGLNIWNLQVGKEDVVDLLDKKW
ncbi:MULTISPECIES: HAD family phosphatase [Flavobacterium]|uniref:HAD family hydrolase n=1 Tax=Flavobacterium TaxID=237 RepID=UPI00086C8C6A|nr:MULTISPECIES: HAD family phosphatase [Flavobacterium]MBN9283196.1 HAD family phosphatase [Flavobacterium sp.]ODS78708.1 MAG: haloacid dehalogenase [Chryseobacterium sp. SCN 40-13]OJV67822.1 MAG: haloacid dehalogenase [Flavobacterium sp. 40-81]